MSEKQNQPVIPEEAQDDTIVIPALTGVPPEQLPKDTSAETASPVADSSEPPSPLEFPAAEGDSSTQVCADDICPPIDMGPVLAVPDADSDAFAVTLPQQSKLKKAWQEKRLFIILSSIFLLLAITAVAVISYVYFVIHPYESYDKILPNVYCAGLNLGGMTPEEAQIAIEDALRSPAYSVKLILPDCEYIFQPRQEGITLNGAAVAKQAYEYGRSDPSAYGIYRAYKNAEKTEYRLNAETDLIYNTDDIQTLAEQIYQETSIAPTEAVTSFNSETHTVTMTLGTPGRQLLPETIYDEVCTAFDYMNFSDITLDYEKVEIDMNQVRTVCWKAATEYKIPPINPVITANQDDHTIDLTMGTQGWALAHRTLFELAQEAVTTARYGEVSLEMEPVEPEEIDITDAYYELACDPTEPYYYAGTVYESTYGYTLDWEAAITQILDSTYGAQLSIPMTPIAPRFTADEIRAVLFRDQLSSYRSPHTANTNRTHNLDLACRAIDGTVINAGETFSFNNIVGERTAAKGYREATVYVGTESKDELGGGICQIASTLYNAALYAEMDITSRASHTFFVTYVPGGLDATIYWGSLDFKFKNNTDYPIRVNASVSGGYVNISIDGTKTNDHVVKLSSTRLSTEPYNTVYEEDSSKPVGYEKEKTYPYTGYTYEAYQYIYDGNGNLLETNYLGKSTYKKRDRVITIGTG